MPMSGFNLFFWLLILPTRYEKTIDLKSIFYIRPLKNERSSTIWSLQSLNTNRKSVLFVVWSRIVQDFESLEIFNSARIINQLELPEIPE